MGIHVSYKNQVEILPEDLRIIGIPDRAKFRQPERKPNGATPNP